MDINKNTSEEKDNFLHKSNTLYDKAEMDLLRAALKRSYADRFFMMTRLMKRGMMLKNAKIIKRPSLNS